MTYKDDMASAAVVIMRVDESLIVDAFHIPQEWFKSKDAIEIEDTIDFHYRERCNLENPEKFPARIDNYFKGQKGFGIIEIKYVDGATH